MGREQGWAAAQTGRAPMHSPGRPSVNQQATKRAFWQRIAKGQPSEAAALASGVSPPVGKRWFSLAGGMPPISLAPPSSRYLSLAERQELALLKAQQHGVRAIARRLGRSPSTVSRELRRNVATRSGQLQYRATVAQWKAERAAKRPKTPRLAGAVTDAEGRPIPGPNVPWKGRRQGRRADRRWGTCWSPEQISRRLHLDYPHDEAMRISHEAIYQALYIQGRGALRRDLSACLSTGRALRVPRARHQNRGKSFITPEVMISERPAEVADRAVPGHWEGDMIMGLKSSAIGTLVERTTRFTILLHLPPMAEHGSGIRLKNGPALAGHGAEAVRDAIAAKLTKVPNPLRKTLTWDQGAEMTEHRQLRLDTDLAIYFCDPRNPWQRSTNENTNGLLRQYLPKGTDISRYNEYELDAVANTLNNRPRKALEWKTPREAFDDLLAMAH